MKIEICDCCGKIIEEKNYCCELCGTSFCKDCASLCKDTCLVCGNIKNT